MTDVDKIDFFSGLRVRFDQLGADDRRRKIVGDQAADNS